MALTFNDYMNQPVAERIVLVEISKGASNYYFSDKPYVTESGDALSNVLFDAIIAPNGLPRLKWSVPDFVHGRAAKNYGTLKLSSFIVSDGTDLRSLDLHGATIEIRLAAPRKLYPYSDAIVLFAGEITDVSGNANLLSYVASEQQSNTDGFKLPINRFDKDLEAASFPPENDGRFKPLAFGYTRNISAFVVDSDTRVYQVHDIAEFALNDITAVYDNGVPVTFTKNLAGGEFTLTNPPAGQVTADVTGAEHPGGYLVATSESILGLLLETYIGLPTGQQSIDINDTGFNVSIGFYLTDTVDLKTLFTNICRAKIAWWSYDRNGDFRALNYSAPDVTAIQTYFEQEIFSIKWSEDNLRIWRVVISHNRNYTILSNPAASLSVGEQEKFRKESSQAVYEDATIKSNYPDAVELVLDTYFDAIPYLSFSNLSTKIFELWGVRRIKVTVEVPLKLPLIELGNTIALEHSDSFFNGNWVVLDITDNIGGKVPTQTLELWR